MSLYVDCKDVAKEEIEFDLSKLYRNMEEPTVKLFRERKYPLFIDTSIDNALNRASCKKMSKHKSHIKRKDNEKKKFDSLEKNRKRDIREWYEREEQRTEMRNNVARRGDIPM